jgi:glycosyltransferase involved in cell wall biosynthesis
MLMTRPMRIAQVGPVATSIPPSGSSSVELFTSLLTEGLVARGHHVTLFATGTSRTSAELHATFDRGYREHLPAWPWELCELLNLSAALERAAEFDVIHYQAIAWPMSLPLTRLVSVPLVQTVHHAPGPRELSLWARYPEAPFVAISHEQASLLAGLNVIATIHHGVDTDAFTFSGTPRDYLLYLGRFTQGKGVLQAIEVARRTSRRLILAAPENDYYRTAVAPHVDGTQITYAGEVGHAEKVALLGGAQALLYPVQSGEPFGLVLAEAFACGTPVAALDRGAVREIVEHGITGGIFSSLDELVAGLPAVIALDRALVRARAVARFGLTRMIDGYEETYVRLVAGKRGADVRGWDPRIDAVLTPGTGVIGSRVESRRPTHSG